MTRPYRIFCYIRKYFQHIWGKGDTSTVNDVVINQYESLPYPAFSSLNMSNEELHYKMNADDPAIVYHQYTLEKNNHYLYQGAESFK